MVSGPNGCQIQLKQVLRTCAAAANESRHTGTFKLFSTNGHAMEEDAASVYGYVGPGAGAGFALFPNGIHALRSIGPDVEAEVTARG
jgi:hypothetical protein